MLGWREFEFAHGLGAPDAPGGRPPDLPPTPQCLFPPDIKTGPAVAPADSVGGGIDDSLLDSILPVLATTYDEQDVRERLSPPLVRGVHALQGTHSAGWITTPEYEEALLQLFTQSAAGAAPTSTTPSPADRTSGGLGAQVVTATARDTEFLCGPSPISPRDVLGAQVPTNSTTAHPVDHVVRVQGVVKIETLPGGPIMLQGPSRGLCPAQTSGSPMTLNSASAAGSASKADVNLECVETGPSTQASGSARVVAPALEAPSNAISNPNPKQTQHGNDRRFYYPDLLRAACHYCDHLPGDTHLQVIITRFPINLDGRLTVPESEAELLLQDLVKNRAPKGLPKRRKGHKRTVSPGAAYDDFYTVMAEIDRAGVKGGLTFQAPTVTLDPGVPTDNKLGRPQSMRFINGRKLRTVGDYRNLSPADRAYLDDQERCWTGFGWPGRDRDRRPAWRPRPAEGYPLSDGLRCSVPATALVQCPALISLLRHQWTSQGWEDPLEAPDLDPFRGHAGEDCAEAFDDEGFSAWYLDQA